MSHPIAVIDTSVVIWLATPEPDSSDESQAAARSDWLGVRETIRRLEEEHAELIVPSPVIAELGVAGKEAYRIRKKFLRQLGRLRIETFDYRAAEIAGEMAHTLIAQTKGAKPKQALKFDSMIAAVAVSCQASQLIMAGDRYFSRALQAVAAPVEVVDARKPKGQLVMFGNRAQ